MNSLILVLFALAIVLSLYEFAGVLKARAEGLTKSTGRVLMRGVVFLSVLVLLWQHWDWQRYMMSFTKDSLADMRVGNIPFLVSGFAVCLISILIMSELVNLVQARRAGLTKNTSRLVTSVVILLSLLPIMYETVRMWDRYMEKVESFIPSLAGEAAGKVDGMVEAPGNAVRWFEIYVDDMARAKKFYETVFQIKLTELPTPAGFDDLQMYAFPQMLMDRPGTSGALAKMKGFKPGGNSVLVYFSSRDCNNELARVEKAGGKIFKPKESIGEYGHIALVHDTEGNMIGIHSMK